MLVARNEAGELINLLEKGTSEGAEGFFCPVCGSPVRLKKGQVMRPHFAHISLETCQGASEHESFQHLTLKSTLYGWAKKEAPTQLEAYLPEIEQIADVLVADTLALEIQCSRLSLRRLKERTRAYQTAGYSVLWLLGKDLWLRERLTQLHRQFLSFSWSIGFYLWELDSEKEQVRLRYLIHEDLHGRVQYLTKVFSFGKGSLLSLLRWPYQSKRLSSFQGKMDKNLKRYIAQKLYYRDPKWMREQEQVYLKGENILEKSVEDFYPQIRLPLPHQGFAQVQQDLSAYYTAFEAYYQKEPNKQQQTLYPPLFYRKQLAKIP